MSSREAILAGGNRGPAVKPGSPSDSLLFRAVEQSNKGDWTGKDHSGRTIFTREGGLFYVNKNKREVLLRDFNPDKWHDVPAPGWAQTWTRRR